MSVFLGGQTGRGLGEFGHEALITSSATWISPVTGLLAVTLVGGGGGGGGDGLAHYSVNAGGGGGAGGSIYAFFYCASKGERIEITIGGGGTKDTDGQVSCFGPFCAPGGEAGKFWGDIVKESPGGTGSRGYSSDGGNGGAGYKGGGSTNARAGRNGGELHIVNADGLAQIQFNPLMHISALGVPGSGAELMTGSIFGGSGGGGGAGFTGSGGNGGKGAISREKAGDGTHATGYGGGGGGAGGNYPDGIAGTGGNGAPGCCLIRY